MSCVLPSLRYCFRCAGAEAVNVDVLSTAFAWPLPSLQFLISVQFSSILIAGGVVLCRAQKTESVTPAVICTALRRNRERREGADTADGAHGTVSAYRRCVIESISPFMSGITSLCLIVAQYSTVCLTRQTARVLLNHIASTCSLHFAWRIAIRFGLWNPRAFFRPKAIVIRRNLKTLVHFSCRRPPLLTVIAFICGERPSPADTTKLKRF